MAFCVADILEVVVFSSDTDAFLACGGAFVVAVALSKEDIFELIHPRIGEEERWVVVGDDGRRGNDAVPVLFEVVEEFAADILCLHDLFSELGFNVIGL